MELILCALIGIAVAAGTYALTVICLDSGSPGATARAAGDFTVTLFGPDGTILQQWTDVETPGTSWKNNRVVFRDPESGQKVILKGTTVVEGPPRQGFSSKEPIWSVTLYGGCGQPVREWKRAVSVAPVWENDRLVFIDAQTGSKITLFGTVLAREHSANATDSTSGLTG